MAGQEEVSQFYVKEPWVYLETADYRLFAEPYGPFCSKAVGQVFCLKPIQGGEYTKVNVSFVESISPLIFDKKIGNCMRIKVKEEAIADGKIQLHAQILSTTGGCMRQDSGKEILITLFPVK